MSASDKYVAPRELIMVRTASDARRNGFTGPNMNHPNDPSLRVWWPGQGVASLLGLRFERVTVDAGARRLIERYDYLNLREMLTACCPNPVWIEL